MGKLRRLALASLEICSYIGHFAIQFSMRLRNSALNNRMCLWVQFACRVCPRVTPGSKDQSSHSCQGAMQDPGVNPASLVAMQVFHYSKFSPVLSVKFGVPHLRDCCHGGPIVNCRKCSGHCRPG